MSRRSCGAPASNTPTTRCCRLVACIERLKPFPDVLEVLGRLHQRYRLAILSNGDRDMLEAAKPHIGFDFDAVISVEEAGYFKPHHATYAKACELLGVDRSSVLFVANHAFDCIGAKAYGMRTAFIDRRRRPFGAFAAPAGSDRIEDFAALARLRCRPRAVRVALNRPSPVQPA